MDEQTHIDTHTEKDQHNHRVFYTSLGLLLGVVVLLLVVVGGMYMKEKQAFVATQTQEHVAQTAQQTPQEQLQQSVTPVPVATKADLTVQQNALDSTDMNSISLGLDQNSADASSFSQ